MEDYEKIQQENKLLIKEFEKHLKGLSKRTIRNHVYNIELFLNDYLAGYDGIRPQEVDTYDVESFMRWCIDKWMFNTASGLVSALTSIKIFYQYLQQRGIKKNIIEIVEICGNKDYYVKKFNQHEKLLRNY